MMPSPSARIRAATVTDCEAIGCLHVAAWRETYRDLIPGRVLAALSAEVRAMQWRSGLMRGASGPIVLVAEAPDGMLTGFGAAGPPRDADGGWEAEILALYLLRSSQRQGLGTALMHHLAAALRERKRRAVGLWVLTANAGARAFYENLGGRPAGSKTEESDGWRARKPPTSGMICRAR